MVVHPCCRAVQKFNMTSCVIFCHIYHLTPLPIATSLPLVLLIAVVVQSPPLFNRHHCYDWLLCTGPHLLPPQFIIFLLLLSSTAVHHLHVFSQSPGWRRQLLSLSDSSSNIVITSCSSSSSSSLVVLILLHGISQIYIALTNDVTALGHVIFSWP